MKKMLCQLLVVVAVAAGVQAVATGPAAAACWRESCNGLDPQASGCASGAVTRAEFTAYHPWLNGLRVELRYSSRCDAHWTRGTQNNDSGQYWVSGEIQVQDAAWYMYTRSMHNEKQAWTPMLGYTYYTRACYSGYSYDCTAYL